MDTVLIPAVEIMILQFFFHNCEIKTGHLLL